MSFKGKVALVTGASSGMGAASAIKFAKEGAKVAIVGRNKQKLDKVAKQCGNALIIVAEVSKDEDVRRIIDETIKAFGQLDILVNSAGVSTSVTFLAENAMKIFDEEVAINLRSVVYLTHLAAPYLVKTKGSIVNISSNTSLRILIKDFFSYDTTKAGLDQFTKGIAVDLAPYGVRANSINPGPVRTDVLQNMGLNKAEEEACFDDLKNSTALGRVTDPEEIADLVLFLSSEKAKGITGSIIVHDNGQLVKPNELKI